MSVVGRASAPAWGSQHLRPQAGAEARPTPETPLRAP
jgi:hypothetical protein